ncbi:MAG: hotdog domain-containing protein [Gammaproteobacteria bacterium]|jgi:acyl-coenzyme A thioesterase PaaI-like protein
MNDEDHVGSAAMPQPATHLGINAGLCGEPVAMADGEATVRLVTTPAMGADDHGLVHGGFVFGLADYAAMLAVNHPNVVLGSAEVRFLAPVRTGATVLATARLQQRDARKHLVDVTAQVDDKEVFRGTFVAFTLDRHVLEG